MYLNRLYFIFILLTVLSLSACKENQKSTSADTDMANNITVLTQEEINHYTETGKLIAKATFKELSGKLQKALKEGGVQEAAEYCNVVALPLTDSLAKIHDVNIKRTSLKLRNPENKPTNAEIEMLNSYEQQIKDQMELKSSIVAGEENQVHFYAPILTQQLCLTCHGTIGEELTQTNYDIIKALYPDDSATGYKENELRGMWRISFDKSVE